MPVFAMRHALYWIVFCAIPFWISGTAFLTGCSQGVLSVAQTQTYLGPKPELRPAVDPAPTPVNPPSTQPKEVDPNTTTPEISTRPNPSPTVEIQPEPTNPAENSTDRLKKILIADNTVITDIAGWIEKSRKLQRISNSEREFLTFRIRKRLDEIRQMYMSFLKDHPKHTKARIAYGSFLKHIDDRQGALGQWEKALADDPSNAAALNNIATHIGTIAIQNNIRTRIPEAFLSLEKAIALAPKEALYHHNFATTLSLFRLDAMRHYKISAGEVTQRALTELGKGMELAPDNFEIAADRAETFLDIKPLPRQRVLQAWERARTIANQKIQRDWVNLQIAIVHLETGELDAAETNLNLVSKDAFQKLVRDLRTALSSKRAAKKAKP